MSKNLTRKGLALGAIVALGASVFAGSPAFAANELNVAPSAGTSYTAVAGSVFNLATTFAPGYTPAAYEQLKYIIKTDANSAVSYDAADSVVVTAPATTQAVSLSSTTAVSAGINAATDIAYLGLQTAAGVNSTVEVTAFVDSNNGGTLTAGLFMGFDRKSAARYSFLLAIPAVLASGIYEFATTYSEMPSEYLVAALVGTLTAFVVGYLTIAGFLKYISNHSLWPFVVYRVIAGAAFIFTYLMGNLSLFA